MNKKIIIVLLALVAAIVAIFGAIAIYYKVQIANAPTMQELAEAYPWKVPDDWFQTDTITLKGRIEGYDAEKFGFTSMRCSFNDVFESNRSTVLVLNIAEDGTFCKKFLCSYPVQQVFYTTDSKVSFHEIPFFARPGETIDVTVRKGSFGRYKCIYNNGSSKDVERWLRNWDELAKSFSPLWYFEGTFEEANEVADMTWKMVMLKLQKLIRSEHYTPMEVQLTLADAQARFGTDYLGCIVKQADALVNYEKRDSLGRAEILDSAEWKKYCDAETYAPLRRIDFDNPLLFASYHFYLLQNRIEFARPVATGSLVLSFESYSEHLTNYLAALQGLMGDDHNNLMAQLCAYKDFAFNFDTFREEYQSILTNDKLTEEQKQRYIDGWPTLAKMMPLYLDAFKHPYFRQKAEQFRDRKLSQKDLVTQLPYSPAAEMIRTLAVKYPGMFLFIDFWGMSCGPCRAAIQQSKELRAEIAKRDDVKLIFIAEENTPNGSDAYKKYVAEWLAGEEAVCVSNAEFSRLQEMFEFNGIPHYETITPDGYRVSEDYRLRGYENFDGQFEKLKEKLLHN
ncbi:MAG: thioredoxin family protein [Bacteroidaceae bacterium]|nr:thioredoxin family protein [Bacteroidaceae bacterium]